MSWTRIRAALAGKCPDVQPVPPPRETGNHIPLLSVWISEFPLTLIPSRDQVLPENEFPIHGKFIFRSLSSPQHHPSAHLTPVPLSPALTVPQNTSGNFR